MTNQYPFERFAAVNNYSGLSFSPDGQQITYVNNVSGQLNVWRQPVHLSDSGKPLAATQLTALMERGARGAIWSPDGKMILTLADMHGTENFQLYAVSAETGWPEPLTNDPEVRHEVSGSTFSPDGSSIVFTCNARNPANMDVTLLDLASGTTQRLTELDGNHSAQGWSPDGRTIVVTKFISNTSQQLLLLDVATGELTQITDTEQEAQYRTLAWHPDNSGFYLLCDLGREFNNLAFYNVASSELSWVEEPDWDVIDFAISKDGRYAAWLVNENGYSELYVRDLNKDTVRTITDLPRGVRHSISFSPSEPLLGLHINRSVQSGNIYMLNVKTDEHWQLTQSYLGGIPASDMVEPELIHYPTHDDRNIPAFLYKPAVNGDKFPVVLSIHGGPQAQELPTYNYNGLYQYLLNNGIGILAPNIRGSTGYGKTYEKLINRDWGGAELKDLEHAAKYLYALDWVDNNRIGVFGGSFGGFATLSCISRLPQYFDAAVDIVGPSNLVTFAKSVPPHWRRMMRDWVGDPEDDYDMLVERSPINYVNQIEVPLLIIQGANDPRVVQAESDQIVAKLKGMGRDVDYMLFEDEGHGFTKSANMLKAMKASADWFVTHFNK